MTTINKMEFHDACGIGFIAEVDGIPSRRVIDLSIEALKRMSHRGASGSDERTSDGIGLLTDIPHKYFKLVLEEELLKKSDDVIGIGMVFTTEREFSLIEREFSNHSARLNINYLGLRIVPINSAILGEAARATCPTIVQFFFSGKDEKFDFETRLYLLRKSVEQKIIRSDGETFICSLSSKTIVYKGMMKPNHLARFYSDLTQPEYKVKVSLFHERFSTNTISSWSMAQPFRMLGHNGEINTIKGNKLWMQTREAAIRSNFWGDELEFIKPIVS